MKSITLNASLFAMIIVLASCGNHAQNDAEDEHDHNDAIEEGGNQALYDQVMAIHDEVMPKMNDLYKLKEELKDKIAQTPAMPDAKKAEIEGTIAKLDSASENMMIWMRNFNPLPDSLGEDQAKEYLENEMEKIKGVRAGVEEALEKGNASN